MQLLAPSRVVPLLPATTPARSLATILHALSASTRMLALAPARGVLLGATTRSLLRTPARLALRVSTSRTTTERTAAPSATLALLASTPILRKASVRLVRLELIAMPVQPLHLNVL